MDLQNTLSTITDYLGGNLGQMVAAAASYLPANWEQAVKHASSYLPTEIDLVNAAQFMLFFAAGVLILSVLSRVVLGKRSSLNHSLSSAIGILFIYAVTIVVYTFKPWNLELLLSPLPFVSFSGQFLVIFPIADAQFPALCSQLLSLVILAFLVNLIDTFLPKGDNPITWFVLRLLTVVVSMILNLAARWAFQTYLPGVLVTYAPSILLVLLVVLMLSGVLNLILGLVISMTNPFLGAMYTFFFSNIVGKQLSKAVFTTAIISAVVFLLGEFGYTVISVSSAALAGYIPLAVVLLLLWFLIGHLL